ncbi:MAG: DUF3611 family protein [Cyanosarcina radialis HA8281-LM2]|jgi:hypothetical protein|nr:DUF3611 family protein [Cyanosarcina radialis HA8281-LM2]
MVNIFDRSSHLPSKKEFAGNLRPISRISYWIHLLLGTASGITLLLVAFSRGFTNESRSIFIGFSIFLAVAALIAVGFRVYWALRYTRMAKRLQQPDPTLHPKREEVIRVLRIGLIVSLAGLVLAFGASEITTVAVLAKSLAQPQGVAVYDPEKIVRGMDLFLILADVNLIGAHILGSVASLGLLDWITKE